MTAAAFTLFVMVGESGCVRGDVFGGVDDVQRGLMWV
jgi:hypothetical protein